MAVCAAYRIPHSEFLAWDVDDREKAIAWHLRESSTCQSCGTRPEEWDPDQGGDPDAYEATEHHCRGCRRLHAYRSEHAEELRREPWARLYLRPAPKG